MRIHEAVEKALKEKSPITRASLRDFGFKVFPTDLCCGGYQVLRTSENHWHNAPAAQTYHSPAGTSALSDRHSGRAAAGLRHRRCSGACCLALHPVGGGHHDHQHLACDLCWLHAVCPVDGAPVLFQARKNGS